MITNRYKSKRNQYKRIEEKIEKLTQLHQLSSLENVLITVLIASFILGVTLYASDFNVWWNLASIIIIFSTFSPVYNLLGGTFQDSENKIDTIIGTILQLGLILISVSTFWIAFLLSTNLHIKNDVGPILIFSILESWGLFINYWDKKMIPSFEQKFYLLISKKQKTKKLFKIKAKHIIQISTKPLIYVIIIFLMYWSFHLQEYLQTIIIGFIGILNTYLLFFK